MAMQSVVLDELVSDARDFESFLENLKSDDRVKRAFRKGLNAEREQEELRRAHSSWAGPLPGQALRQELMDCFARPTDS
jgi:hypothetical protein